VPGLAVAIAGFLVNRRAILSEQTDRKQEIDDAWAREWAAQRPVVYPLALPEWAYRSAGSRYAVAGNGRLLPLKNGGRGPALDVRGEVTASTPDGTEYSCEILASPIAADDLLDARIVPHPGIQHWENARGVIRYKDLAGGSYETRFRRSLGPGSELVLTVDEQTHVTLLESSAADSGAVKGGGELH